MQRLETSGAVLPI